jgi:hypothetical protein
MVPAHGVVGVRGKEPFRSSTVGQCKLSCTGQCKAVRARLVHIVRMGAEDLGR